MRRLTLLPLFVLTTAAAARADDADVRQLLTGVDALTATGEAPAPIAAFSPGAFPVAFGVRPDGARLPVIAASRWERGRLVAFGSEGFLSAAALARPGNASLLANAARWTSAGHRDAVVVVVDNAAAADVLERAGLRVVRCSPASLSERMEAPDFEAVVTDLRPLEGKEGRRLAEFLSAFVRRGGGAILVGNGRQWLTAHPDQSLARTHNGNFLTAPMGVAWTRGTLTAPASESWLAAPEALTETDSRLALQALWKHADGSAKLADPALIQATLAASAAIVALPGLEGWFSSRAVSLCRKYPPTLPVNALQPAARLQFSLDLRAADLRGPEKAAAHPTAAAFPGSVPGGPRVTRSVTLAGPGWRATGLYAAPGETVTVSVPETALGRGLSLMIGAHAAPLWRLPSWERFPQITVQRPILTPTVKVASAFGGPIRVFVPGGAVEVSVAGAVDTGAPWTTLEGANVTLTVPSGAERAGDPVAALALWDERAAAAASFVGGSARVQLVVDRQTTGEVFLENHIAVAPESIAGSLFDLASLKGADAAVNWGPHLALATVVSRGQRALPGGGSTVALLVAQWLAERSNGATDGAIPDLAAAKRQERAAQRSGSVDFRSDPLTGFDMLYAVRRAFGWEPLQRGFVAAAGASDPTAAFVVQASRAANRNLALYFENWGVAVPESAKSAVARLPRWAPER